MNSSDKLSRNLAQFIRDHARVAWDRAAAKLLADTPIHFVNAADVASISDGLAIPIDCRYDDRVPAASADCFGRQMPLLHPWSREQFPAFEPVDAHPWLWRGPLGVLMPAFNFAGAIDQLVSCSGEAGDRRLDEHCRLIPTDSILGSREMLHIPVINVWLFALLATAKGLQAGGCPVDPTQHVLPPVLVLSHDCDQLRGNDCYTQMSRLARMVTPLTKGGMPDFKQAFYFLLNTLSPRRYFFDDALAMLSMEQQHGFKSAFYFLTGSRGRLGARSGSRIVKEFAAMLPNYFEVGIHYNYRYSGDRELLRKQKLELEALTGRSIKSGRAHYLALDPRRDFSNLRDVGILNDESVGFSQTSGFRVGYAGAFRVWEQDSDGKEIVEIPLVLMDTNMVGTDGASDPIAIATAVERVGGVVTVLFHPGAYKNPEFPELFGVYDSYLEHFARSGYRPYLPYELGNWVRSGRSPPHSFDL